MIDLNSLKDPLDINDIDFRVQSLGQTKDGKTWAIILAYKDARVDINRLNNVCGIDGWQRKYELIDGQLFCSVGVYSEKINGFVWKQDVGTESNTEREKGRASDSFKRACFNLGIGIELYSFPLLFTWLIDGEFYKQGDKIKQGKGLKLNDWKWVKTLDNGKIKITAQDKNGKVRINTK